MGGSCSASNLCGKAVDHGVESESSYEDSSNGSLEKPKISMISNLDTNFNLRSFQSQEGYDMKDNYSFPFQKTSNYDFEEGSNNSIYILNSKAFHKRTSSAASIHRNEKLVKSVY